jgi:hypothetical protein
MASPLSRRTFLLGALATAGAAACTSNKSKASGAPPAPVITVGKPSDAKNQLNLLETTDPAQLVAGVDQRLAFVLKSQDFIKPDAPVTVAIGPGMTPDHLGQPFSATIHTDAGTAPDYVTVTYRFPAPGDYWSRATYKGQTADAPLQGIIDASSARIPIAGKPMISTPTPTFDNHRGVEPICTRTPTCPWHDVSLDVALTQHRPLVVLFATPKLCQTATCGPVLDLLLSLRSQFEGRVRFLHSEIYTDLTAKTNTPAVLAYNLTSEPIMFLAGADGTVKTRFDGLFGHGEAEAAIAQLVS